MSAEDATKWKGLADQARAGEVYVDDEAVARECLKACGDRLNQLNDTLKEIRRTQTVSGFGDFTMADDLAKKFTEQGTDIETSLREHIETVKNMQEVFRLSLSKIVGQDVDNAGNIKNTPA
ncbi:hypothetical protein BJY24_001358 [Nocardia transvalensis]|uniref:Uncharacterized protein n=1 Tax=Nocardia transvalensis TaxID=37333 RepID=A0A7W9PAH0_9NOCA|nr:hypothetical protein [Nocardia transvalensis]MBB5912491.1 hypothetical protein [Nocardia transvalensis]